VPALKKELQKQPEGVAISANRVPTQAALSRQIVGEKLLE